MAYVRREETLKDSQVFVEKLKDGSFLKDHLTNCGEEFKGCLEDLTLFSFSRYIGSASYAMMKLRSGQYFKENYHGY